MNPSNTCYISKKDMEEIKSITTVNNENTIYGFMVVSLFKIQMII